MLRSHIDHSLKTWGWVHNLQRRTIRGIRQRQWHSGKLHEHIDVMVIATIGMGEHMQTMGRQAATVVFPEVNASVIAISDTGAGEY